MVRFQAIMSLIKSIEKTGRTIKSYVGEPKLLRPAIKKIRSWYNDPKYRTKKLEHIIIPEVQVAFAKIAGETLSSELLEQAKEIYAMTNDFGKYKAGDFDILLLYCLVRQIKPEVVIETGICSGRSSSSILEAMKDNNRGTLYSIDLPRMFAGGGTSMVKSSDGTKEYHSTLAEDADEPGWLVPAHLKKNWQKILGDSNVELPKLVSTLSKIDIFYHDSDHTYETMTNEMTTAWPKIPNGGIMIVDDANCTSAYQEFKENHTHEQEHLYSGFGVIKK